MSAPSPRSGAAITCPSWCVAVDCAGDHWSNPGSEAWPTVKATSWAERGIPSLTAHPTWGECDGLAPAVGLWITGDDRWELDESIDLTPDEAERLAHGLIAAAKAARA